MYNYEGLTLVLNTTATLAGLFLGSHFLPRSTEEQQRTDRFFLSLATPVHASELAGQTRTPAIGMLGMATLGVGVLLLVAGIIASSSTARLLDSIIGLILAAAGLFFNRSSRASSAKKES